VKEESKVPDATKEAGDGDKKSEEKKEGDAKTIDEAESKAEEAKAELEKA
jgi:hypothetical protein